MTDLDVLVVGGGIAGLATAYYAHRGGLRVAVLEADAVPGGKVGTTEFAGGPIDTGPDAYLARVPGAVDLAADLGLTETVSPATGQAWVWSRGRLRSLPSGLVLGVPSRIDSVARSGILSPAGLARAALAVVVPRRPLRGDTTIGHAFGRHLGRAVVDRLIDPLLGGINASDCDRLSLEAAAPTLVDAAHSPWLLWALRRQAAAQQRGQIGVTEAVPVFSAPRGGARTLITALLAALPAGAVRTGAPVSALQRDPGGWAIPERGLRAPQIVLATPAPVTAGLLGVHAAWAASELRTIRYSSVAMALLAYSRAGAELPPGSGMLVPRVEGRFLSAASWFDQKWPHHARPGLVVVRASTGRDGDTRFLDLSDEEIAARAHDDLATMVGLRGRPAEARVVRWVGGFPQYEVGHVARVEAIERSVAEHAPGVSLVGAALRGVGLPACIRGARAVADRLVGAAAR